MDEKSKPTLGLGTLLLAGVMANLAAHLLGFSFPAVVVPFAALAGAYYGASRGFLVGFTSIAFSQLLLFSWTGQTWIDAFLAGIGGIFGIRATEPDFLFRVFFATLLFANLEHFEEHLAELISQLIVNALLGLALVWLWLKKEKKD